MKVHKQNESVSLINIDVKDKFLLLLVYYSKHVFALWIVKIMLYYLDIKRFHKSKNEKNLNAGSFIV